MGALPFLGGLAGGHAAYQGYQVPERSGSTRVVSARFVEHAHRAGLAVQVWTVNDEATRAGCSAGASMHSSPTAPT